MNAYNLGRIAAIISRDVEELTPSCLDNLSGTQAQYLVILRHVWPRAQRLPRVQELASAPGYLHTPTPVTEQDTFWLGFHHEEAEARADSVGC
jgi:hypothetical protein